MDETNLPNLLNGHEASDVDFTKLFFYIRLIDSANLTSFSNADIVQGDGWVVHFYGDGAATCSAYNMLSPSETRVMIDSLKNGLKSRNIKELELVGFNGNQAVLKQLLVSFKLDEQPIKLTGDLLKEVGEQYIDNQVNVLKSLKARFSRNKPAQSGTLQT